MSEKVIKEKKIIKRSVMWAFFLQLALISVIIPSIPNIDTAYSDIIKITIVVVLALFFNRKYLEPGWFAKGNEQITPRILFTALGVYALYILFLAVFFSGGAESTNYTLPYAVYMGIIVPIGEELLFRTVILQRLKNYGYVFSVIASTILFAFYHSNFIQLLTTVVPGLIFAYVALRYSVKWTIIFHIINNGFFNILLPEILLKTENSFIISYGKIIIASILVIIGIIAAVGQHPFERVREFLSRVKYEKGAAKVCFINVWFFLMVAYFVFMSAMLIIALTNPSISSQLSSIASSAK